jgi:curli biogenesis system outer membrane secretion channel CsgG
VDAMTTAAQPADPPPAATVALKSPDNPTPAQVGVTPFPPPLENAPAVRKRRLGVEPFDFSAVKNWVTFWFHNDVDIGQGIRAMLVARMHQSKNITLLERTNLDKVIKEQDMGTTNRFKQGKNAKVGKISGADCMLFGDIVIFGHDDKSKGAKGGIHIPLPGNWNPVGGAIGRLGTFSKEERAVVGINLRIVDTETGEVIETAEARGESTRKSKDWGALLGTYNGGSGVASGMTSSNFEETIIGEATSDAVNKIVAFLEGKVPKIPAKAREIEGRVVNMTANGAYLTVGSNDGVELGDRFEILQINNEVIDPATKEVLDVEAVKVGELVVNNVRDKTAVGNYGGEPLSSTRPKGYTARLMTQ